MSIEQAAYSFGGALLIGVGIYLASRPSRNASIIENYYNSRANSETASGIWGKTVFLPGKKTSSALAWTITLAAFGIGIALIIYAF